MTDANLVAEDMTNWGRWGAGDERGALNLITPEMLRRAAASIRTGRTYPLGIPIQADGVPIFDYRGKPMRLTLQDSTDAGIYESYGCAPGTGAHGGCGDRSNETACSPIMTAVACIPRDMRIGAMDTSTIRNPPMPRTRQY
jgi:hypothetical protein